MKKRVIIAIGIVTVLFLLVLYYSILKPVAVEVKSVRCRHYNHGDVEGYAARMLSDSKTDDSIRILGNWTYLPSVSSKDYMICDIDIVVKNRNIFENYYVTGNAVTDSDSVMWATGIGEKNRIKLVKRDKKEGKIRLMLYVKDLSKEEIKEVVKSICIVYNVGKDERKIYLKKIKNIEVE